MGQEMGGMWKITNWHLHNNALYWLYHMIKGAYFFHLSIDMVVSKLQWDHGDVADWFGVPFSEGHRSNYS